MTSTKLSVPLKNRLAHKYSAAGLSKIDIAVTEWVSADKARGIDTIHVALDDAVAMGKRGVAPVTGRVSANKIKRAIDGLWKADWPQRVGSTCSSDEEAAVRQRLSVNGR